MSDDDKSILSPRAKLADPGAIRQLTVLLGTREREQQIDLVGGDMGQPDIPIRVEAAHAAATYLYRSAGYEAAEGRYGEEVARAMFGALELDPEHTPGQVAGYTSFYGEIDLRPRVAKVMSDRAGVDNAFAPEHVLFTSGGSEAVVLGAMALATPDPVGLLVMAGILPKSKLEGTAGAIRDLVIEVIGSDYKPVPIVVPTPYFQAYGTFLSGNGFVIEPLDTGERGYPTPEQVETAVSGRDVVFLSNIHGNNPTGIYAPTSVVQEIIEVLDRHKIPSMSDELYWQLNPNADERVSTLHLSTEEMRARTIFIDGMAKGGGAPGLRQASVVCANPAVINAMAFMGVGLGHIHPSTPGMEALVVEHELSQHADIKKERADHYAKKHALMRDLLRNTGLLVSEREDTGGPYFVVQVISAQEKEVGAATKEVMVGTGKISNATESLVIKNDGDLSLDLRAQYGIKSVPLSAFYGPGGKDAVGDQMKLRIVLDGNEGRIRELAERLKLAQQVYQGKAQIPAHYPPRIPSPGAALSELDDAGPAGGQERVAGDGR